MPYNSSDLTIVSSGRFVAGEPGYDLSLRILGLHLAQLATVRCGGLIFVDLGSNPAIKGKSPVRVERAESDFWSEAGARNVGMYRVTTPLVAFTRADCVISQRTIDLTLELANNEAPERFLLQGYPWVASRTHTDELLFKGRTPIQLGTALEDCAIPVAAPCLPSGDWQVFRTEDVLKVGGFNETITTGIAADLHERVRALRFHEDGNNEGEKLTDQIPVVRLYHPAPPPPLSEQERGASIKPYLLSADPGALDWRKAG